MTPKSLLRNERATSRIEDFTQSAFQQVLGPTLIGEPKNVDRVIFCSGKVYYDLAAYLETNRVNDAALVRVEQLYPLNLEGLEEVSAKCATRLSGFGARRSPETWGPGPTSLRCWLGWLGQELEYAGRPAAASPAVGSKAWHDQQQKELVHQAFSM